MPLHDYACSECGVVEEFYYPIQQSPAPTAQCECGATMRRRFSIPATPASWVPHYNASVGRFVRTESEFKAALRQGSEEMSKRMGGYPVNFQSVPIQEAPRDEAHLEATRKRRRDSGKEEAKRTYH